MKNVYDINDFVEVKTIQSIKQELVSRFKKRRKESDLTQRILCKKSGVSYGSIRRFEEKGEISLSNLMKLSEAIGKLEDFEKLYQNPIVKDIRE
jgi:transcriptional regulator with XRE-family HTH domain